MNIKNIVIKNATKVLTRHELRIINIGVSSLTSAMDTNKSTLNESITISEGFKNEGIYPFKSEAFGLGCIFVEILLAGRNE